MSAAVSTAPATPAVGSPAPPRGDTIRDSGTVRRDSIRATGWTARGMAKILGDVDVGAGTVTGLVAIGGSLTAESFRSRGTLDVHGSTAVRDRLAVDGTVHFGGSVRAGAVDARGTFRSPAELRVDRELTVVGTLEAPSARVGLLDLQGAAEIPGELSALGTVRARFHGDSRLGFVRARSVRLEGPPTALIPTLFRKVFGGAAAVEVGRIEAESVELRAVEVDFVRAKEIVLGPGAHVTTIEGTVVRRHPTSRVGPESRSPPPHGLSR